ncbi:200 kDa antigen p200 [Burkholderia stabilis]|nr:200 kDa antigen p200 [Burkholderia stabilis]
MGERRIGRTPHGGNWPIGQSARLSFIFVRLSNAFRVCTRRRVDIPFGQGVPP